ncbi:hypothetical protein D1AOALGA4SA_1682 [Olavius algarvensis Delta 1 endosymbiont]|nr:hypothetical protein D1AOALGA4SA_1682 [Olavius algarvensis Delta 1 endosymbiont]
MTFVRKSDPLNILSTSFLSTFFFDFRQEKFCSFFQISEAGAKVINIRFSNCCQAIICFFRS